jgi:predicted transcriptional regulator
MPPKKTSEIKARVPESMRAELEAIAEERGESTSVIARERLRSGVYFDPELVRKLAEIAKEESTTITQIVERFVNDGIACRAEIRQMAEQFRRPKRKASRSARYAAKRSPLLELARLLVCFDHVARWIECENGASPHY